MQCPSVNRLIIKYTMDDKLKTYKLNNSSLNIFEKPKTIYLKLDSLNRIYNSSSDQTYKFNEIIFMATPEAKQINYYFGTSFLFVSIKTYSRYPT